MFFPKLGEIQEGMCGYKFSDAPYVNPHGVSFPPFIDDNGKSVSLCKGWASRCPAPPDGNIDRPKVRGMYYVPLAQCKKCEYRRKGRVCALMIEPDRIRLRKSLHEAFEKTSEIFRGVQ